MNEVVPHVVPDSVVSQLHAVAVLSVQEVSMSVSPSIATTPHIPAHQTYPQIIITLTVKTHLEEMRIINNLSQKFTNNSFKLFSLWFLKFFIMISLLFVVIKGISNMCPLPRQVERSGQ